MGSLSRTLVIARLESCKQFYRVACLLEQDWMVSIWANR